MFGAIAGIAGGILGAAAGAQGSNSSSTNYQDTTQKVNLQDFNTINKGASALENSAYKTQFTSLRSLQDLVNQGPGASAVSDANSAGNDYAQLLQSFLSNSGLPNQSQMGYAQNYASQMFNPQQVALKQSFTDQNQEGARLAARLGRSSIDPVLRNKLGVEQTRQQQSLNAQQGAFAAQTANGMPQQQLGMAESLFNVRQNLASQAFNNRQTLMALGNQLASSERQYRVNTATRTTNSSGGSTNTSGGGTAGAISGALAGVGGFSSAYGTLSSMFGGGASGDTGGSGGGAIKAGNG